MGRVMKKVLLVLFVAFLLMSCNNDDDMEKDEEIENPKIYKVTYNGNGNTEGEVPVDDNLYAEGDTFYPQWSLDITRNKQHMWAWEVSNVASVENPIVNFMNGTYLVKPSSAIKFSDNDIELKAVFMDDDPVPRW